MTLFVSHSLPHHHITLNANLQAVAVRVHINQLKQYVPIIYLQIKQFSQHILIISFSITLLLTSLLKILMHTAKCEAIVTKINVEI